MTNARKVKPRLAKAYWLCHSVDKKRYETTGEFANYFDVYLINSFYEWHKPQCDEYALVAKELIIRNVNAVLKRQSRKPLE